MQRLAVYLVLALVVLTVGFLAHRFATQPGAANSRSPRPKGPRSTRAEPRSP